MQSQIFINLPVTDLQKSVALYTNMGFSNNPQFSDDTAKCMAWGDNIFVMLMTHEKFKNFTQKPIANMHDSIAALYSLSVAGINKVHEIVTSALAAGATEVGELRDYGFMQQRSIADYDGYTWEIFCMDMSKFPPVV